jgi:hypothetical protein
MSDFHSNPNFEPIAAWSLLHLDNISQMAVLLVGNKTKRQQGNATSFPSILEASF